MSQRSLRLQEAGYHTRYSTPVISYKERLFRVFYRRRTRQDPHSEDIVEDGQNVGDRVDNDSHTADWETNGTQSQRVTRARVPTMCSSAKTIFLLMFLLAFGFIATHMKLRVLQDVQSLRQQMDTFVPLADTISNFALESQGARVIQHLSSHTYRPWEDPGLIWRWMFSWWYSYKAQRRVIQGHSALLPGQCWCFAGEQGHLFISLSHPVSISHVTLGHISKSQSPHGGIESAPREFSIYGARTKEEAGTYLGTLVYDLDGTRFQTFNLSNPDNIVFRHVKLQTEINWGNVDYTCLYSFQVHGKLHEPGSL